MNHRVPILALLLALAPMPFASAQSAEDQTSIVTFYGHVFGIGRTLPMPMNTQAPQGESDLSQGFVGHECGVNPTNDCEVDDQNEEWFYTTAGFVQIKDQNDFSYEKLHNERGLTKDTRLDTSQDITATFYMSADYHGWPVIACQPGVPHNVPWPIPCWQWDPGYLSQWQVEATVYTGILGEYGGAANEAPDIAQAFTDGKLKVLATGLSDPQDVQSLEIAGQPTVWKFDVNLGKAQRDTIPKEESYVVRFQWWSVKPDGSRRIVPELDVWNVNSGDNYPPVVKLPVKGAFNVEMVLPQFVYGKLVVLGIMNTPWGSYDVDQDSITLEIVNEKTKEIITPVHLVRLADFSVAHGGHYKPVNVTYVWDYAADRARPGDYTVTISASNFQGSASASCTGRFSIAQGVLPGEVQIGECGISTTSAEHLQNLQQGSAGDAKTGKSPVRAPAPVPEPVVRIAAADVEPVSTAPPLALAMALALGLALVRRRWSS